MSVEEILGRREDQRLEFKSAGVLAGDLESVAREVVGMLNAEGGEIWIGVEDEDDVAVAIEPVADPSREERRLLDYLLETVDPAPLTEEVRIETRPAEADPAVLVVTVQPLAPKSGRRPFAYRKRGGWHFLRRIHARNHPMSRDEIFDVGEERGSADTAVQLVQNSRSKARDSGRDILWLCIRPVAELDLDLQQEGLQRIALDPSITGNRRSGAHFARTNRPPRPVHRGLEWGQWPRRSETYSSRVQMHEDGALEFFSSLSALEWGDPHEIYPIALLEMPVSAFRIARAVYQGRLGAEDRVVADLALFGVRGWKLRRGTPETAYFRSAARDSMQEQEEEDLIWTPLVFRTREVFETPDRCGFRLVRRVYRSFGITEDDMPRQYDRETGRLILPE